MRLYDVMSNKNKFRVALLFDGFLNKLVILAIVVLVLMEDIRIGIMPTFNVFCCAHSSSKIQKIL